jgi:hypothetical protein
MPKSTFLSFLGLLAVSVRFLACSAGGTDTQSSVKVSPAGTGGDDSSGAAGSGGSSATTGTPGSGGDSTTTTTGMLGTGGNAGSAAGMAGSVDMGGAGGMGGMAGAADGGANETSDGGKPSNAVVLFDGSAATFNSWASVRNGANNPWKNNGDGTMTVNTGTGDIQSKQKFQDLFVHVEYKTPMLPASVTGQERGNSGIYLKGSYEMQVLDTYGQEPAIDGCGAVYSIQKPLVTACYEQEKWNTYEIEFKAQVCNAQGQKTANARMVKVTLNGVLVQQDVEVPHTTTAGQPEDCMPKGLLLQDHSSVLPVSYRNIWVIPRN